MPGLTQPESRLRHGDSSRCEDSEPVFDQAVDREGVRLQVLREAPYEVHFRSPKDQIAIPLGYQTHEIGCNSDARGFGTTQLGTVTLHPTGSEVYVRTLRRTGDLVVVDVSQSVRERLTQELDQTCFAESRVSFPAPVFTEAGRTVRAAVLGFGKPTRLEVEDLVLRLCVLAQEVWDRGPAPEARALSAENIRTVIDFMDVHLDEDLSLEALGGACGLSPYHFCRSFKRTTGYTPHRYVVDRRLARARQRLESTRQSIDDVALSVGFSSQSHMTDAFRRFLGVTPGRYRQEMGPEMPVRQLDPERLGKVFDYVEASLHQPLQVSDLASVAGLSVSQFSRAFKKCTGQSPHQYLLHHRLQRAREMLARNRRSSIAEIAYECGFSSQSHMTDLFRAKLGVTPGNYRKVAG